MVDAGIGRLLVASLHQGIADVTPSRLEFYENWLSPQGLRDGRMGMAPLNAVLSFLRREGPAVYERIMTRAGHYAAEWTHAELAIVERTFIRRLPVGLRSRAVMRMARRLVRDTFHGARFKATIAKGNGTIDISDSIFCSVRGSVDAPTCVFYAAAVWRLLTLFQLDADVVIAECRAAGGARCRLTVTIRGTRSAEQPAEAA